MHKTVSLNTGTKRKGEAPGGSVTLSSVISSARSINCRDLSANVSGDKLAEMRGLSQPLCPRDCPNLKSQMRVSDPYVTTYKKNSAKQSVFFLFLLISNRSTMYSIS